MPRQGRRRIKLSVTKMLKRRVEINGKLASLNKFLAKSAEKSLPFFKTLKKCTKKSDFLWTEEAEAAFKQMKEHIAKLPMLTAPEEQKELIVYLAASKEAKDQRKKVRTTPQKKKNRSRHGGPCSWTGHLALTDAEQE
ncbi:reverse transcriptase domain-containing protein [Tanacetum coccineum]